MAAIELFSTPLFSDANLVSYYRAESTADAKGSNTLTNNGTVAFNAAKFNNGFDFGSSNSSKYMSIASGLGIDLSGAYSVSFWVKITSEPGSGVFPRLIDWRSTTGTERYALINYTNPSGTKQLDVDISGGTGSYAVTLGTAVFHHIVLTVSSGGAAKLYLDGTQVLTATRGTGTAGNNTTIGGAVGGSLYISGIIDDAAFFSRELSSTDVSNLYNGTFGSPSPSLSPSLSISLSPSLSISPSPSASVSPSSSISLSPSISASVSVSLSPSVSESSSFSLTGSASISPSPSSSISPSGSTSLSESQSVSLSVSATLSPSSSSSLSPSKSGSLSISRSSSPSHSPSRSRSLSISRSPSVTASRSNSPSPSVSDSPSPSAPLSDYTREAKGTLPTNKDDLATTYTTSEEQDVDHKDGRRVSLIGISGYYLLHEFKKLNTNRRDKVKIHIVLQSTLSCDDSTVYLQVWNGISNEWETLDTDSTTNASTDIDLRGEVSDTSYYDFNNEVCCRVYQLAI